MRRSMFVALVVAAAGTPAFGQGPEIWAVRNVGSTQFPADPDGGVGSRIVRFNAATPGTVTKVGNTGVSDWFFGMDFLPDGRLIGVSRDRTGPGAIARLYTISTSTGAATNARAVGGIDTSRWVPQDLAFDPFTNSLQVLASGTREFAIFRLDADTGAALSSRTFSLGPNDGDRFLSLAFNSVGTAFVYNGVRNVFYRIGQGQSGVGAITSVSVMNSTLGGLGGPDVGAVIDWRAGNTFYAGLFASTAGDGSRNRFYTVNGGGLTPTGGVTLIGTLGHGGSNPGDFTGFGDFAIVPAPGTGVLLGLGVLGFARRRRSR